VFTSQPTETASGRDLRLLISDPSITQFNPRKGQTYFIPLRGDGRLERDNDCAVLVMRPGSGPGLEQDIDRLITAATATAATAATAKGVPASRVPAATTPAAASRQDGVAWWPAGLIAAGTLAAAGTVVLILRRRRS
jgi:hypothetical protein